MWCAWTPCRTAAGLWQCSSYRRIDLRSTKELEEDYAETKRNSDPCGRHDGCFTADPELRAVEDDRVRNRAILAAEPKSRQLVIVGGYVVFLFSAKPKSQSRPKVFQSCIHMFADMHRCAKTEDSASKGSG